MSATITTVVTGPATLPAARRFRLSRAALRWLDGRLPGTLPPSVTAMLTPAGHLAADLGSGGGRAGEVDPVAELATLGLVTPAPAGGADAGGLDEGGVEVTAGFQVTWGVLTAPHTMLQFQVAGQRVGRAAVLTARGEAGVGIVEWDATYLEVSVWPRARMAGELSRLVPPASELGPVPSIRAGLTTVLTNQPAPGRRAPVDLTDPDGPGLPRPDGRLSVDVLVRSGAGPAAGTIRWACTQEGWWHVRNGAAGEGGEGEGGSEVQRRVWAVPVQAPDLGREVTRLVAAAATWLPPLPAPADPGGPASESGAAGQTPREQEPTGEGAGPGTDPDSGPEAAPQVPGRAVGDGR